MSRYECIVLIYTLPISDPPNDNPSIQQIPAGGIVRRNEIKLICTVPGGNPLAILTWDCDGTISNETTGNIASYSVTFVANRTLNNKICTCSASHVVMSYKPSISHQLIVYCKYNIKVKRSFPQRTF